MTTNINAEQLKKDAQDAFHSGFTCSESVIYAIRKNFGGCICGALAGSAMCIGFLFGRTVPGDPKIDRCFKLTHEFHDYFKETCGGTCCRVLTRGMEKNSPERKAHCADIVDSAVTKLSEILIREIEKDNISE